MGKGFNIYQRAEIYGTAAAQAKADSRASSNGHYARAIRKIPPVHSQYFWSIVVGQLAFGSSLQDAKSKAYRITKEPRAGLDHKRRQGPRDEIEAIVAQAFEGEAVDAIVSQQFGPAMDEGRWWK